MRIYQYIYIILVTLLSICGERNAHANEVEALHSIISSGSCPASTTKRALVFGSCTAESERLKTSNSNDTYRDFMRCNNSENELNRAINDYNKLMYECDRKKEEEIRIEKENAKALASEKGNINNKSNGTELENKNRPKSEIERRLEQARAKSQTIGLKSRMETESMTKNAIKDNQDFIADVENKRKAQEKIREIARQENLRRQQYIDNKTVTTRESRCSAMNSKNAARCRGCVDEQDCARFCGRSCD